MRKPADEKLRKDFRALFNRKWSEWDIQEGKRCGRQRQKDKIAVDEVQEDVFVICTKTDNNNLNYHYVWEKYVPK